MTRGFTFPLQRVLDVYEKREEMAEQQWAACLARERELRLRLDEAEAERDRALGEWASTVAAGAINSALCMSHRWYIARRQQIAAELWEALTRAQEETAAAFQRLLAARRDRQALEALRDRAEAVYRRAVARYEMRVLDELGTVRYWRQSVPSLASSAEAQPLLATADRHGGERSRTLC